MIQLLLVRAEIDEFDLIDFKIDIMEKWNRLQTVALEKDERLKENRKRWKHFKRQLEDLEQAAQQFSNMDNSRKLNHTCSIIICSFFSTSNGLFKSGCSS
jgi:hypothetical protein